MEQRGSIAKIAIIVLLVIIGGFFFGYRSVHAIESNDTEHKAAVAKAVKVNQQKELVSQLAAAWKKVATSTPPDGNVDIAIYDSKTGAIAHYTNAPSGTTYNTASIIKMSILETLLLQNQKDGIMGLTASQLAEATPMIENSDNDAATALWDLEGGAPAVNNFFQRIGTTDSTANVDWGLTQTTALDQLKVVNGIAYPTLLSSASVAAADNLLDHVESDQQWGVSGGVPAGVSVELKNGWLEGADNNGTSGWNINSIGHIHGDGVDYTMAALTDDNDTMQDGINTIQAFSTAAWNTISAANNQ